ncbi:hypothetical protein HLA99_10070, partial [Microbacterium ulmi]|nr:hypothetical protein [Microbacterium ulmi]
RAADTGAPGDAKRTAAAKAKADAKVRSADARAAEAQRDADEKAVVAARAKRAVEATTSALSLVDVGAQTRRATASGRPADPKATAKRAGQTPDSATKADAARAASEKGTSK